jgi:hypothetical protein
MASVIARRRLEAPIGTAAGDIATAINELFPGIALADAKQFHVNRDNGNVNCLLRYDDEMTLSEAQAAIAAGEDLLIIDVIPD